MASLLGKADSTLISAARSEAMANVPADLSGVYKRKAKNFDGFLDMVNEAFDTQTKADKEKEALLKEKTSKLRTNLASGITNDAYSQLTDSTAKDIALRLKDFEGEKDSLEYKKIEAEMSRLVAISGSNNDIYQELINSDIATLGTGKELDLFLQMIDDHNNNTNNSNITYDPKDKDYKYTLKSDPSVSMTMSDLERKLSKIEATGPLAAQAVFNDVGKNSNKRPWDESYQTDTKNALLKALKTPNNKYNIMMERFPGMKHSFYEALGGKDTGLQQQIFDALDGLPGVGLDANDDGVRDSDLINGVPNFDYNSPGNAFKIQEAISKSHNGDEIIAGWLTKNVGEDIYDQGENKRRITKEEGNKKTGNYMVNGSYMNAETFQTSYGSLVKMINNPQEGDVGTGRVGSGEEAITRQFIYKNGEYYTETPGGKPGVYNKKTTAYDMAVETGLVNYTNVEAPSLDFVNLEEEEEGVEAADLEEFGRNANVSNVLSSWAKRYKGMGFTITASKPGINQKYTTVTIKAKNEATHTTELGRTLGKGKEAQAKEFNKFIEENKI